MTLKPSGWKGEYHTEAAGAALYNGSHPDRKHKKERAKERGGKCFRNNQYISFVPKNEVIPLSHAPIT